MLSSMGPPYLLQGAGLENTSENQVMSQLTVPDEFGKAARCSTGRIPLAGGRGQDSFLCGHQPRTRHVRPCAWYDGIGPTTIVRLCLANLSQRRLPAAPRQKSRWLIHRSPPGSTSIG